jgi:hypothetical protein
MKSPSHDGGLFLRPFLPPRLPQAVLACMPSVRTEHCRNGNRTGSRRPHWNRRLNPRGAYRIDVPEVDQSWALRPQTSNVDASSACSCLLGTCRLPTTLTIVCEHTPAGCSPTGLRRPYAAGTAERTLRAGLHKPLDAPCTVAGVACLLKNRAS